MSNSRRRARDQLEDDDTEIDTPGLSDDSSDTQAKRPRLGSRTNGVGRPPPVGAVNGVSSLSDFSPGSIVRVTMQNFVTYEHAEFFPGPNLNMVIGPNGTGKSSLVCAICLGLGWGPGQLGRAGSIKEFVKHGKDNGTIEIELKKRPEDRLNYTIRTQIRREQNTQKWWLNGKETTHKKIKELTAKLKIQVDNLCQFLPQDRVVEFAQCTPVNLLHETLRAAAPEEMLEQQTQLKALHKDKRGMLATVEADQDQLKNLENRQEGLQADVDRIREREVIEAYIKKLKVAHLMSRYNEARSAFQAAKQRLKEGERNLKKLKEDSGPALKAIEAQSAYYQKVKGLEQGKIKAINDAEKESKRLLREAEDAATQFKDVKASIQAESSLLDTKRKDMGETRTMITRINGDLNRQPPEFNGVEWNQKIREQEHLKRDLEEDQRDIVTQLGEIRQRGSAKRAEMNKLQGDLESLESEQGRQLRFMERQEPDAAKAWEWIQANPDKFEKEVFPPPMISCSIKDDRFTDQVQALMSREDFVCFMAQTTKDAKTLSNQLYRGMSLNVVIRQSSSTLDQFQPPVSPEQAEQLGLDGFALDYIEGPDPVLAMLCSQANVHRAGVALKEHDDAHYEKLLNSGSVNNWVAGRTVYGVRRRREYGPQAMTTITKTIQPGKYWSEQPVDSSEKSDLRRRLSEVEHEFQKLKEENKTLSARQKEVEEQMTEIEAKATELRNQKSELQKEYTKWLSLPKKLEMEQDKSKALQQDILDIKAKIRDLQYEQDRASTARARAVIAHAQSLGNIAAAHNDLLENRLWQVEAESDIVGLKQRSADIVKRLNDEKELLKEVEREKDKKREEGRELQAQVEVEMSELDQAIKDEVTEIVQQNGPEDLHNSIAAEEAKLELIHSANPNVIREFERRATEMERLRRKIEASEQKVRSLTEEIEEITGVWEPKLMELVREINDAFAFNFEQINCSGEVHVHKDKDFDLWAIDIMVKFRESEELQQLNAHRQSGGERAVSTIFYLMALQSLAQSPFRVVDEINQGMDPRNERMVHERMVEIACREHTSQYFLITPKLLTGLRYDPKMRVLCIASGEHMPKEGRKLDFKKCLKIQKGLMAGA